MMVYLEDGSGSEAEQAADLFSADVRDRFGLELRSKHRLKLGELDAVRYEYTGGGSVAIVTFFPFDGGVWRIVAVGRVQHERALLGNAIATARSFRALGPKEREEALRVQRLRVVRADPGEDAVGLTRRTGNEWDPASTALVNGLLPDVVFAGGERLKIKRPGKVEVQSLREG